LSHNDKHLLVGGLEHDFYFPYIYIGNFIIPTGPNSMIFRGVARYTTNQIFVNAADWWVLFHASWLQDVDVGSRPVAGNPRLLWGAFNRNASPKETNRVYFPARHV